MEWFLGGNKMKEGLISVIIPAYNVEKYLGECLDSVLEQTYDKLEIVVVNDGSTDRTQDIIEQYQKKNPEKIHSITQENAGQSAARNKGLSYVNGEYLAFIDADDYIYKDYMEVLITTAKKNRADLVICGYEKFTNDGNVVLSLDSTDWDIDFAEGIKHIFQYSPCAKLYSSRMILDNHILFGVGEKMEDGPFGIITSSVAKKSVAIKYFGYRYRLYDESTMGVIRKKGLSKSDPSQQFPYKGIENAIEMVKKIRGQEYDQVLEFVIIKALAGYCFKFSKNSDKETKKYICKYSDGIIQKYFPKYYKNPYVSLNGVKQLPFYYRAAISALKWTHRFHILYPFSKLYTFIAK